MRAREIEKWLVKVLHDGATELVDAEVARHIARVFDLLERMQQKFRPKETSYDLFGSEHVPTGELSTSLSTLRARAAHTEKVRLEREASASGRPSAPAGARAEAP